MALRRALDRILARHEVLRTTFVLVDGRAGAADRSLREQCHFLLLEHDLRGSREPKKNSIVWSQWRPAPLSISSTVH